MRASVRVGVGGCERYWRELRLEGMRVSERMKGWVSKRVREKGVRVRGRGCDSGLFKICVRESESVSKWSNKP